MDLADRVRQSSPPHERVLAAELVRVHDELFDDQTRGLHGAATLLLGGVFGAALAFPPALATLSCVTAIGVGAVIARGVRRHRDVRRFSREARLVEARAIAPEQDDALGRCYLLLEIPDDHRHTIARVTRSWSRSFFDSDLTRVPVLYAPGSRTVLCFDPRGEPILGHVETRPLPRAVLAQR